MGQSDSKGKQMFLSVLRHMLAERGFKVSDDIAGEFYEYMMKAAPWFPREGTLSLPDWKRLGKDLKRYATNHAEEPVPRQMFPMWLQIRDALTDKSDLELLAEEVQSLSEQESCPLVSTGSGGYGTNNPAEVTYAEIEDNDDEEGDLEEQERQYEEAMYPEERDHHGGRVQAVNLTAVPKKGKKPPLVPKLQRKLLPPMGFQAAVQEA